MQKILRIRDRDMSLKFLFWAFFLVSVCHTLADLNKDIELQNNSSKVLSRKRRYLVFPEGSSLQLGMSTTLNNSD